MKKLIVGFIAGIVMSAGVAYASNTSSFLLKKGDQVKYGGITCTADVTAKTHQRFIVCKRPNGDDAFVSTHFLIVLNENNPMNPILNRH